MPVGSRLLRFTPHDQTDRIHVFFFPDAERPTDRRYVTAAPGTTVDQVLLDIDWASAQAKAAADFAAGRITEKVFRVRHPPNFINIPKPQYGDPIDAGIRRIRVVFIDKP